jgi:hypothetical protein
MSVLQPPRKKTKIINHCPCCPNFQEWRETCSIKFVLPKGEYFIGDVSSALDDSSSCEINDEEGRQELSDGRIIIGFFEFTGLQREKDRDSGDNIDFTEYIDGDFIGITLLANVQEHWECHGISVVFEEEFLCCKDTISHFKHDDHSTNISFGGEVSWNTIHGSYDTDDGSIEEEDDEDEAEEAEVP